MNFPKTKNIVAGFFLVACLLFAGYVFSHTAPFFKTEITETPSISSPAPEKTFVLSPSPQASVNNEKKEPTPDPTRTPEPTPEATAQEKNVLLDVPFTPQAPFGNWKDPVEQDACEEASALMAMAWARGFDLTPEYSLEEILAVSDYEEEIYGNYHDTDAEDTAQRIYREYFKYDNIEVRHNIGAEDIKKELFKGNLVVVPANGRKLGNPYYTPPGPLEHNLVIRGYDAAKKQFITNDPGIMHGANYRYKESVLEKALQDYPTGHHEPITEAKTAMIIIHKSVQP